VVTNYHCSSFISVLSCLRYSWPPHCRYCRRVMDLLSITAAVAGFVSLAGQIATTLNAYVDSVRSAPNEVKSLYLEVKALSQVLGKFAQFVKDDLHGDCVLFDAVESCGYQLKALDGKLADLSKAFSKGKLQEWAKRMGWPLKKDDVQQTIFALQRFTHIFEFSMVTKNYELLSQTSSAVISRLDDDRQNLQNIFKTLETMSTSVPEDLQKQMTEISEMKTLVTELAQLNVKEIHNISLGVNDVQGTLQDDVIRQIMPLISKMEIYKRHQDIRQKRIKDTGKWFLLEPAFRQWSHGESPDVDINPVFACSGDPGVGKSVICSLVFDYLQEHYRSEEGACVACLYCDYQNNEIQTPENMIGVLLKQVISRLNKSRLLSAETIRTLKDHLNDQKRIDLEEGCRWLGETIKQLRKFYICIDALDECDEAHRAKLIQALATISSNCSQPDTIRIFFTTRPHIKCDELVKRNPGIGSLHHMRLKARQEDIRIYLTHEIDVDENKECMDDELRKEILDTIVTNSDGMFLLASLQIQTVLDKATITRRSNALRNMSEKLEAAFEGTMTRIMNQKPERSEQAMDVLKWVFLAKRPLKMIELRHALSVTIDLSTIQAGKAAISYDETVDWEKFTSEKSLIDCCLGLIVIDEETATVRLVHKSLHDHLTQLHDSDKIFPNGHTEMAYTCLQYMSYNDYESVIDCSKPKITQAIKRKRLEKYRLLDYAVNNFRHHLHDQSSCTADMICAFFPDGINLNQISTGFRSSFLSPFIRHRGSWDYEKHEYIATSQMHLRLQFAISCGLENAFISLLDASNPNIDHDFMLGASTMLLQASHIGKNVIVQILLKRGVNINLADSKNRTALSWASEKSHESVVKLLLDTDGIDINSKDDVYGQTALSWASEKGRASVVKLLLDADGIDINSQSISGRTALSWACQNGHDSVVKLLLQADGIDINSNDDEYGQTALSWASKEGHESVVKLLLKADGIDINKIDNEGLTALSLAYRKRHHSTAQLLLAAGAIVQEDDSILFF
ncbi:hypothetical protein BZA77DRAFT_162222, partial [Pyronema omphalodes]